MPEDNPTLDQEWNRLTKALAECLSDLDAREYLIISSRAVNHYVQFAGDRDGSPNFFLDFEAPVDYQNVFRRSRSPRSGPSVGSTGPGNSTTRRSAGTGPAFGSRPWDSNECDPGADLTGPLSGEPSRSLG